LFLRKKTPQEIHEEERSGRMADYPIFMAMVDRVGHDKRGYTLYKRDEQGNEILVPDVEVVALDDTRSSEISSMRKVIDDQTLDVPAVFAQWREREGVSW